MLYIERWNRWSDEHRLAYWTLGIMWVVSGIIVGSIVRHINAPKAPINPALIPTKQEVMDTTFKHCVLHSGRWNVGACKNYLIPID